MNKKIYFGAVIVFSTAIAIVGFNNCGKSSSPIGSTPVGAESCPFPSSSILAKASTFGTFNSSTMNTCLSHDGSTDRWDLPSIPGYIALPSALFSNGETCGLCAEVTGANGTILSRVVTECPSCSNDTIDMDLTSFTGITGETDGIRSVSVKLVPCPVTQDIKYYVETGTNPFYLYVTPINESHPVKSMRVDNGTGWQDMDRSYGSFQKALGSMSGATVQVEATDIFDNVVTSTIDMTPSTHTSTTQQFPVCD